MLLVTGPTGNVGAELTRQLVDASTGELAFRLAAHHPEAVRELHGPGVDIEPVDYADRSTWPGALAGVDTLFLLFPLPHPRRARTQMVPFVQAAAAAGVKHVIYVTVPGADTRRAIPHHAVERAILASGMSHTFLRCGYFSQNMVRAISTHGVDIADHDEVFIPAKASRTTLLDARDAAAVARLVAAGPTAHQDRSYVLTGPEALGFDEVAATLTEVLGREIRYTDPSMPAFWRRLRKRGVAIDTLLFMSIVYRLARRGTNSWSSPDLEQLLGRPATPFATYARDEAWRWETRAWT